MGKLGRSGKLVSHWKITDRKQAEALGLEVTAVSLQQLIVHLTNGKFARKAVDVR